MKFVLILELERQLLIFLLLKTKRVSVQYIILSRRSLNDINIKKLGINNFFIESEDINNKLLKRIKYNINILKLKKILLKEGDKVEVFAINEIGIMRSLKGVNLNIIEDGIVDYLGTKKYFSIKIKILDIIDLIFGILKRKNMFESLENVKKIYLTGLAEIPKAIKDKVEIINLEELWSKKSEEEKKQINEIFGVNIESLQKIEDRKIILFTQPLSEDGIISEEEKIEIYSKILEKYQQKDIIIKPHPREKTNYSDYFPECYVMKEKYPVELMILNGLKVDRAITLFSTAVFSLNKMAKVDFYGTEVHPKLLERFGSMDHIIKRNCYL